MDTLKDRLEGLCTELQKMKTEATDKKLESVDRNHSNDKSSSEQDSSSDTKIQSNSHWEVTVDKNIMLKIIQSLDDHRTLRENQINDLQLYIPSKSLSLLCGWLMD